MLHDILEIDTFASETVDFSPCDHDGHAPDDDDFAGDGLGHEHRKTYADRLLTALATMAVRSKRRQADLSAALRRSGLEADPVQVSEALHHLACGGFIEHVVPLYDGGVLMSVTTRGVEQLNAAPRWTIIGTERHASAVHPRG